MINKHLKEIREHLEKVEKLMQDEKYLDYLDKGLERQNKLLQEKDKGIERLHSIIKEVREYIENNGHYDFYNLDIAVDGEKLLEILDEVDKENK